MEKKICFVITPIGNEQDEIRRHIDGIIDQAIIPALGENFQVKVAHKEYEIGSINERIIQNVYKADLVIANLTMTNPNVMFELAIRYSFGKPSIVIAEKDTKLPFDIIDENTIFYINDPQGAAELKESIRRFADKIDWGKNTYGPVYSAVRKAAEYENVESNIQDIENKTAFSYLVKKIADLEMTIKEIWQDDYNNKVNNDFSAFETVIRKEFSIYENKWRAIKQETPFSIAKAEKLINDIENFTDELMLKSWTLQEKRYIKGKMTFLTQKIRNFIYQKTNSTIN